MTTPTLPAPRDARLDDLEVRRSWLSHVEVHNLLPREGILYIPGPELTPAVAITASGVVAWSDLVTSRARALGAAERVALELLWAELWRADTEPIAPGAEDATLLHYRGLFRAMPANPDVIAYIAGTLG